MKVCKFLGGMSVYVDRRLIPFKKVLIQGSFLSLCFLSFSLFLSTSHFLFLSPSISFFLSLSLFLLAFVSSLLCLLSLYLSVPITFSSFWFWPFLSSLLVSSYLFFSLLPSLFSSFFPSLSLALSLLLYLSLMSLSFLT